jgi:hypothetical protein
MERDRESLYYEVMGDEYYAEIDARRRAEEAEEAED